MSVHGVFVLGAVAVLGLAVLGLTLRECLCHLNPDTKKFRDHFFPIQFAVSGCITVSKQNYKLEGDFCLKVWAACVPLEFINHFLLKCVPCCE